MFWQNEEFAQGLGRDIHLDGVVCVVDAVFGKKVRLVFHWLELSLTPFLSNQPANGRGSRVRRHRRKSAVRECRFLPS